MLNTAAPLERLRVLKVGVDADKVSSLESTEVSRRIRGRVEDRGLDRRDLCRRQDRERRERDRIQIDPEDRKLTINSIRGKARTTHDGNILRVLCFKGSLAKSGCGKRRRTKCHREVARRIAEVVERSRKNDQRRASIILSGKSTDDRLAVTLGIICKSNTRTPFMLAVRDDRRIERPVAKERPRRVADEVKNGRVVCLSRRI